MATTPKFVLVTGCSAGSIGAALCVSFASRHYQVFATARTPSKIPDSLTSLPNVVAIALDVTVPSSIAAAVDVVDEYTNGCGLHVLINCSGAPGMGPVLDVDISEAQRVYDVNVWGPIRVVQAFSKSLRGNEGCVVNVSSIGSTLPLPYNAVYASSKCALNCLSETMRLELAPFGVRVITLMAGVVESNFTANIPRYRTPINSLYEPIEGNVQELVDDATSKMKTEDFAESVVRSVEGGERGKVWLGAMAGVARFVSGWFPGWLVDRLAASNKGLEKLGKPDDLSTKTK